MAFKNNKEKISYIIGRDMAANFQKQGLEIDPEIFLLGFKEATAGQQSQISPSDAQSAMMELQQLMASRQNAVASRQGEINLKEGEAFLAENKDKAGVVALPSGLQYEVLQEGSGKSPSKNDSVTTHYHGTLLDGTVFDSSYERGEPATFPVNGVIAGWTEALQKMKEGDKWRLYIPSNLAYGTRGAGGDIGPNATLIFDVELLSVN
ncbi:FKBP-type peptidyl-prolyl cis-trans isomerase [Adhaeribacter swui]|uniref:Peptidyl-prolyl cis-trans isomerase n=1 Tax=Adhaeribacter swui TaxID=2086471 RepID=A0A7G7G2W0_9BACT|nr:FKBP-type peptidyl-prolyl cis-trans isomerase [Adhaeribacter swui]QNF31494.1 FKBP-type peptidyl-prolyl cis-trans isomerase [Adhaeribacter swui]